MRITVIVRANAHTNHVSLEASGNYRVLTTATPEHGKANAAVIALLANFFAVPQANVQIIFGKTAREKIVEITPR